MVKQRSPVIAVPNDSDDSPLSDLERIEQEVEDEPPPTAVIAANRPNRPWARKGKAPVREPSNGGGEDIEMVDDVWIPCSNGCSYFANSL